MNIDLTSYSNSVKLSHDFISGFDAKNYDELFLELKEKQQEILQFTNETQFIIINGLVSKYLHHYPKLIRNGLREYAMGLGIYCELETNHIDPYQQHKPIVDVQYITLTNDEINILIKSIKSIDFSGMDIYADRLTKSDKENKIKKNDCISKLSRLTEATLRVIWLGVNDDEVRKIIVNIVKKRAK